MRLKKVMRNGNVAEIRVDVESHAQEFIERKDELIGIALEIIGTKMADYAAMNLERNPRRVDTGRLKNSLTHQVDGNVVCVGTNVEYAIYVEYGTGRYATRGGRRTPWLVKVPEGSGGKWAGRAFMTAGMKPNHFLRDALQDHENEYINIAKDVLEGNF